MKVLILGFKKSGKAAYELLKNGNEIAVYDEEKITLPGVEYYDKRRLKDELPLFDLCVRSPGIKATDEIYEICRLLSREVISEIELGFRYLKNQKLIAVSGTNGKTTLVKLLESILKTTYQTAVCGNIGTPFCETLIEKKDTEIFIVEVSSFQLEDIHQFKPTILIYTNLTPNHLDSVVSYAYYRASKKRAMLNLERSQIIGLEDMGFETLPNEEKSRVIFNGTNFIIDEKYTIDATTISLRGAHNIKHIIKVIKCALALGITYQNIEKGLKAFVPVPFREEIVYQSDALTIVNDSKSTSCDALKAAINTFTKGPRAIIVGGIYKSSGIENLKFNEDDKIFIYGRDQKLLSQYLNGETFDDLDEVFERLQELKFKQGTILFSPGCSSFDQYSSYKKRGEHFNDLVKVYYE